MSTPDDQTPVPGPEHDVPSSQTPTRAGAPDPVGPFASPSGRRPMPATPEAPEPASAPLSPSPEPRSPFAPPSSQVASPWGAQAAAPARAPWGTQAPQPPQPPAGWGAATYPNPAPAPGQTPHPAVTTKTKNRRTLSVAWVVPIVVLALLAGVVGGVVGGRVSADDHLEDAGLPSAGTGTATIERAPDSVAGIAGAVLPSVVSIQVDGAQGSATGSGFVLRQDGYLVTNHHVIAQADDAASTTITVTFVDGSEKPATIVGSTSDYDLAVLKVDVAGLTPLLLGDSGEVVVGDPVVAIGAPLGPRRDRDDRDRQRPQPPRDRRGRDQHRLHQRDPDGRGDQPW